MSGDRLGDRIAERRHARGLTQVALAGAAGVSVDVITKLEQGQRNTARLDTLLAIAAALDTDIADLMGKRRGLLVGAEDGEVQAVRRAVLGLYPVEHDPPPASEQRRRLGEAWRAYWAGEYAVLARMLPSWLAEAHAAVSVSPDRRGAAATLADMLHVTASLLALLSHDDLAALAMFRALAAADLCEEPLMIAGLNTTRAWLLSRQGLLSEAEHLATATAREIEPRLSEADVHRVTLWGEALRYATAVLSRTGRHSEAREAQGLVSAAAARVAVLRPEQSWRRRITEKADGQNGVPLAGMSFGATLATMSAVGVAVAADAPREALTLAEGMSNLETLSPSLRSRHLLTVAWAQVADVQASAAVRTLREAQRLAPDAFAHHMLARATVIELVPHRRRQRLPGLTALAQAVGVSTTE